MASRLAWFPARHTASPPVASWPPRYKALAIACVGWALMSHLYWGLVIPSLLPLRYDLGINYSAAYLLRTRAASIYDAEALHRVHAEQVGFSRSAYDRLHKLAAMFPVIRGAVSGDKEGAATSNSESSVQPVGLNLFGSYVNPPSTAILLVPLSLVSFPIASLFFLLLSEALYLGSILLLLRELDTPLASAPGVGATVCALSFSPFYVTLFMGQMDGIVILGLMLALSATLKRKDGQAGAWIAAAAAFKGTPIVLLGFFVARARWIALAGALLAGLVAMCATALVAGWGTLIEFATRILPAISKGSALYTNQSLLGAMFRFVTPASAVTSLDAVGDYPALRAVWLGLALTMISASVAVVRSAQLDTPSLTVVALGVFVVVGVLAGSISWDHYSSWAVLPIVALLVDWFQTRWLGGRVFWTVLVIGLCGVCFPAVGQAVLYFAIGPIGGAVSTLALMLILALMVWRLHRSRLPRHAEAPS
jgi:glycosyl transferase family 87